MRIITGWNEVKAVNRLQLISIAFLTCASFSVSAAEGSGTQMSSVKLGATRVIYPLNAKGVTLSVTNPQDFPVLVKSVVKDELQRKDAPFYVTPPLFRLDGGQKNALNITRTGGDYPSDRESINWICVQGIPPKADSAWAEEGEKGAGSGKVSMNVQVIISSCIKLFVRPESVNGNPADMADKITWKMEGKNIVASNPTPFYMNVDDISFNGKKADMSRSYIPPFSSERIQVPSGGAAKGTLKWTVIGDYGEKREKTTQIK
ncbi:fimbria/pilus periplasmic chaperone [Salmonella enterica]|nr:fimbria/pilus periplasmic chaperone [Salmonella enterica]EDR7524790.1 fimbria/pilus periplasmic chaperone [Salmonella enterica subsp. enterica serovar Oranienburg]EFQ5901756.1 fimbria/pilus periplasmic chaperone [Salmonella enterica]EHE6020381.1 fimbria/pilus periplasmic chaperone [Salmonella enterica]EIM5532833.1 fimbria/pilus periplasmic chaperone [Salmonella enterica subsp. enterica]